MSPDAHSRLRTHVQRLITCTAVSALLLGGNVVVGASTAQAAVPATGLLITEIVPDNTGDDNFEFFEVRNTTAGPIDLDAAGVKFSYIYANSDDRSKDVGLTLEPGTVIPAGGTVVVWLSYQAGTVDSLAKSVDDFTAHFAASQPDTGYTVVRATGQSGMANSGERGIRVLDGAGEISRSVYTRSAAAPNTSTDFRMPASGTSAKVLSAAANPTPGVVAPEALTPESTDPGGQPLPLNPRDLLITEFAPDNVGTDLWEYVEVANTTNREIDLAQSGVKVVYDYGSGTKELPYGAGASTRIPARGTAVLWLKYGTPGNTAKTEADFRAFYGTSGEYSVIPITGQDGFANSADRGIRLEVDGTVLTAVGYAAAQIAGGLGVDYRLPSRSAETRMSVLREKALPTPGAVDAQAFVPQPFVPKPDPSLVTSPLQITELAPDTANLNGADAYEFIEVYNSTSEPIDFRDYTLEYLYPNPDFTNSSTTLWPATKRDALIPAGGTVVFWIKNGSNDALTASDFNRQYGTSLVKDESLFEVFSGGMSNSALRGVQIATNTGYVVNRAYYYVNGVDDTDPEKPIQYAVDRADTTKQKKLGLGLPTPGAIAPEQVEDGLMVRAADTSAPVIVDRTAAEIDRSADFPLSFQVTDETQVKTVTLKLRSNLDAEFSSSELIGTRGEFSRTIKAVDLTGKRYYEYELIARDGTHEVSSGVKRVTVSGVQSGSVRLNLSADQWLRGDVPVIAGGDSYPATAELSIDGTRVPTKPQLESAPMFAFEASGVDTFFRNGVKVGDDVLRIFDDGIYSGWETISTAVPLNYVLAGDKLTVSIWAGTKAGPWIDPNENNDDFSVRGMRLILPDGRTLAPAGYTDPSRVLAIGDSAGKLDFYDAVFTIPADAATAVQHLWGTEKVSDGEHTVSASDGTDTATAKVRVDNTAPTVTSPLVEGKNYQGAFTIDAAAVDAGSGIDSLTATLDGKKIVLPAKTSSLQLKDGRHAAVFTARDKVGNETVRTIAFTTPVEDPENELLSPADGAKFSDTDRIELRARATDPSGDRLSVKLNRGFRLTPAEGITAYTGETNVAASPDRSAARVLSADEVEKIARIDGSVAAEASDAEFPYQLFEVQVPGDAGDDARVRVKWNGSANAGAKVIMSVLSADGAWQEVDRRITDGPGAFELGSTIGVAGHAKQGVMTVLVQHSEGFAGPVQSTRESPVVPFNPDATPRSAYDFTLAWETDTQYYNANPENYKHQVSIHDFLLKERQNLNLQYVFHTGDIVDGYDDLRQWKAADPQYRRFDEAKLPYGVLAGNHDVGHKEIDYTNYGTYFGADRYKNNPWWGGDYQNNRGHYDLLSAGGIDFVVLSMGWGPGDQEIAWMNDVLARYPERIAIINLHEYMLTTGGLGPIPQRIYDEVITPNANVRMVMSGHYHDAFTRVDGFDDNGDGTVDRQVTQMLFDYQALPEGGQGFLRLLHFDNEGKRISIRTYTNSYDRFNSEDPSLEMQHQEFTIPYAAAGIEPKRKQLSTDAFAADVLTGQAIGSTQQVESGSVVSASWQPGVGTHGWYAASADDHGGTADSEVRLLTVTPGDGGGSDGEVSGSRPAIAGTPEVGGTLTAKAGTWKPAGVKLAYQWLRNGTAIRGASKPSYTLVAADRGARISVRVTGAVSGHPAVSQTSAPSRAVTAGTLSSVSPRISGSKRVGKVLTAKRGTWKPKGVTYRYQWLRNGKPIAKATKSAYRLRAADAGARISVKVIGKLSGYTTVSRTSGKVRIAKR